MSKVILEGLTVDELMDQFDSLIQKRVNEALQTQVQEKYLSVDEARKVWQPAISRNTLEKWSRLHDFKVFRFGGQKRYLLSDILKQSTEIKQYKKI